MMQGNKGFFGCQNNSFTTKFVWKVAFNTQRLPTGATCMSRRFHIQPLTDIEFWLGITKDCEAGSISFSCYKNNRYPLALRTSGRGIEIEISIDELHTISHKEFMEDEIYGVRFAFAPDEVNKLRQTFSPVWKVLWTFSFRNFEHFKPQWVPLASITLNDGDEQDFPFWDAERFLKSGEFSDLTLEVSSREYKVHKCILAYRTNINKELLKSDKIVLKSENIPQDEMNFVLRYLYTGCIKDIRKVNFWRIYNVAKELDIPSLTEACSKILVKSFNEKTILVVAKYVEPSVDLSLLMEMSVFVVHNFSEISKSEKWLKFKRKSKLATFFEQAVLYYEYAKEELNLPTID